MVRPDRFERPTDGFEAHCSIQLSYGRTACGIAQSGPVRKVKVGAGVGAPVCPRLSQRGAGD